MTKRILLVCMAFCIVFGSVLHVSAMELDINALTQETERIIEEDKKKREEEQKKEQEAENNNTAENNGSGQGDTNNSVQDGISIDTTTSLQNKLDSFLRDVTGTGGQMAGAYRAMVIATIISTLQTSGVSDSAIVGILCNMEHESGFDPFICEGNSKYKFEWLSGLSSGEYIPSFAVNGEGASLSIEAHNDNRAGDWAGGVGLGQWTYTRAVDLSNHDKEHSVVVSNYNYYTSSDDRDKRINLRTGIHIPSPLHQMTFLLTEKNGIGSWSNNLGKIDYPDQLDGLESCGITSFETFKIFTGNPAIAAVAFANSWEVMGGGVECTSDTCPARIKIHESTGKWSKFHAYAHIEALKARLDHVNEFNEVVTGVATGVYDVDLGKLVGDTVGADVAGLMISNGLWKEEELVKFCSLTETDIEALYLNNAIRENLNLDELRSLANWQRNAYQDTEKEGLVHWLRVLVAGVGICFIIWMVFLYIAFWIDRANNIVNIEFLAILSLGFLHISETDEECTFRLKDMGKESHKTVNHRCIISICLCGIAFGVILVSGWYYTALRWLVNKALNFIGRL